MKATKSRLVQITVLCLLIGLSNTASARTRFHVSFGGGNKRFNRGIRSGYKRNSHRSFRHKHHSKSFGPSWHWRTYRPRTKTIIITPRYRYYTEPYYYVVSPQPRVIEKRVVVVQPQQEDEDTQALFEALRYTKAELLTKLETAGKQQRIEAIDELAGFSFDAHVRQALENILLSDPDPELRKAAAKAFGKVENAEALPALEKARVEDVDEDVRREADNAIKKIKSN